MGCECVDESRKLIESNTDYFTEIASRGIPTSFDDVGVCPKLKNSSAHFDVLFGMCQSQVGREIL